MAPSTRLFNFKPRRVRSKVFVRDQLGEKALSTQFGIPTGEFFMMDANDPVNRARPDPSMALMNVRVYVRKYWVENYLRIRRVITKLLTGMGYEQRRIGFRTLRGTLALLDNATVGGAQCQGHDARGFAAWNLSWHSHRKRIHARDAEEQIYTGGLGRFTESETARNLIHEMLHNFARVRGRTLGSPLDHRVMHALGERAQPDLCNRYGFQRPSRACPLPRK